MSKGQSDKQTSKQTKVSYKRKAPRSAWKPGQSGNPKGRRPLGTTLAEHIREIGAELASKNYTRLDVLIRRLYDDAAQGKTQAAALLLERGWGKVPQPIVGEDDAPTKITLHWSEYNAEGITDGK